MENPTEILEQNNIVNPWESTPVVETPVIEQEVVTEPPVETPPEVVAETVVPPVETPEVKEPQVVEKVVEKIVEKQPEFKDDFSRQMYEILASGDKSAVDKMHDYLNEQKRDYTSMSDLDVVKAGLKLANPHWNAKDVDIEIKAKYGTIPAKIDLSEIDKEVDPDQYENAVRHNNTVDEKELLLSRDSRDSRYKLEENKKSIEFPKLKNETPAVSQQPEYTPEQIAQMTKQWESAVETEIPKLSDRKFTVNGEEVIYKASDEEKKELGDLMKGFNDVDYLTKRGWYNDKGEINILKVAEDVRTLEKIDTIVSSAATQMKTSAKKEVVAEIKNIDLKPSTHSPDLSKSVADQIWS